MFLEPTPCSAIRTAERHPKSDIVVAAARACVGMPFRSQGRGVAGFDCLGLVLHAAGSIGIEGPAEAFPLRGLTLDFVRSVLENLDCKAVDASIAAAGDLLLQSPAERLIHLAVRTDLGVVEAHAAIRKVVERPLGPTEIWDSAWRLPVGDS